MSKNILIRDNYLNNSSSSENKKSILMKKYKISEDEETIGNNFEFSYMTNIPTDIDIFSDLPEYVYENNDARYFLEFMRNAIVTADLEGITLSKLGVSEHSETELVIDWIFNYFRLYFSFDSEDGNYFGSISSNPMDKSFSNELRAIDPQKLPKLTKSIINYVVMMIKA